MTETRKNGQTEERTIGETLDTENRMYICIFIFAAVLFGAAFLFNTPAEILSGNIVILTSPANLITDYFYIASIGAALVNASVMVLQSAVMIRLSKVRLNGLLVAAIFTVAGFSLFGKNLYNSLPIVLGVLAYCRFDGVPFGTYLPVALFGTALGPLVSEVSFNFGLPVYTGVLLGILCGFLAGFFLPVLARHFFNFHKGFSLYNIGFTAGIVGTFFIAIFRSFGLEIDSVYLVSGGNNLGLSIFLYLIFAAMLIAGLIYGGRPLKGLGELMRQSGRSGEDFYEKYKLGPVFLNMSLLGLLFTTCILSAGGELNGPTLGGIFTAVGFGASGKHLKNVLPILTGVFLVAYFSIHDISSTPILLAALFGTTLAPVSGFYGPAAGVVTGGLHMILTTNIAFLHAGMNLYNNGFSGGFVAAIMVPILGRIYKKSAGGKVAE